MDEDIEDARSKVELFQMAVHAYLTGEVIPEGQAITRKVIRERQEEAIVAAAKQGWLIGLHFCIGSDTDCRIIESVKMLDPSRAAPRLP